jgi:hypothetical protein
MASPYPMACALHGPMGSSGVIVGGTAALLIEKGQSCWRVGWRRLILVVSVCCFYSTLYSSLIHTYLVVHSVIQKPKHCHGNWPSYHTGKDIVTLRKITGTVIGQITIPVMTS